MVYIWTCSVFTVEYSTGEGYNIESIPSLLSATWNEIKSSTLIFRFLGDFLRMVGVHKSDGLDFES